MSGRLVSERWKIRSPEKIIVQGKERYILSDQLIPRSIALSDKVYSRDLTLPNDLSRAYVQLASTHFDLGTHATSQAASADRIGEESTDLKRNLSDPTIHILAA
jgi:hypothetical protein